MQLSSCLPNKALLRFRANGIFFFLYLFLSSEYSHWIDSSSQLAACLQPKRKWGQLSLASDWWIRFPHPLLGAEHPGPQGPGSVGEWSEILGPWRLLNGLGWCMTHCWALDTRENDSSLHRPAKRLSDNLTLEWDWWNSVTGLFWR